MSCTSCVVSAAEAIGVVESGGWEVVVVMAVMVVEDIVLVEGVLVVVVDSTMVVVVAWYYYQTPPPPPHLPAITTLLRHPIPQRPKDVGSTDASPGTSLDITPVSCPLSSVQMR